MSLACLTPLVSIEYLTSDSKMGRYRLSPSVHRIGDVVSPSLLSLQFSHFWLVGFLFHSAKFPYPRPSAPPIRQTSCAFFMMDDIVLTNAPDRQPVPPWGSSVQRGMVDHPLPAPTFARWNLKVIFYTPPGNDTRGLNPLRWVSSPPSIPFKCSASNLPKLLDCSGSGDFPHANKTGEIPGPAHSPPPLFPGPYNSRYPYLPAIMFPL